MPKTRTEILHQIKYLGSEIGLVVNRRYWRVITMWFGGGLYVNISYRIDRILFLLFGPSYVIIRPIFYPIFLLCQILGGRHEIHYKADIGPGLKVLHTALGTVISAKTVAGAKLTLTGGNLIGGRKPLSDGDIKIGSNVSLGANAVILGPIRIGNNCTVGAGSVVISDFPDGSVLVGVPARNIKHT